MAYPWPGLDDFIFLHVEAPIRGSDTGWQPTASVGSSPVLGGSTAGPVVLGFVSERAFEIYVTPDRLAELQSWIGVRSNFTDWARPTPATRAAMITGVTFQEDVFGRRDKELAVINLIRVRVQLQAL